MYMIRDIPNRERPRERLKKYGSSALSDQELLAIILKSGTHNKSVKNLALDILRTYDDISKLKDITISKLTRIKGIGEVKALELIATIELGKRVFLNTERKERLRLSNAEEIYYYIKDIFLDKKQEYFYALYFNNKQELIDKKLLFIGTINKSVVHPREVFKEAYLYSASSIVCIHNHPSGDTNPSPEDIFFTNNLVTIGKIHGVFVVDHIIIGRNGFYSFYENGKIK